MVIQSVGNTEFHTFPTYAVQLRYGKVLDSPPTFTLEENGDRESKSQ